MLLNIIQSNSIQSNVVYQVHPKISNCLEKDKN